MKCLITGARGFTGKYLTQALLEKGCDVFSESVDLLKYDPLLGCIKKYKPDSVVHLAAQSFVHHKDASQIYNTNVIGSYHLLKALYESKSPLKSVLLASSATVYGSQEGMLSESASLYPANDYAVSKLAMENMAKLWFDQLPIFFVRPFNYTGVGQAKHFLVPKIVDHFKKKAPFIELGNIDVAREFQDVRDVTAYYIDMLYNPPIHKTVNICSGESYTLKTLLQMCSKITGHDIEVRVNPQFVRKNDIKDLKGDRAFLKSCIQTQKKYTLNDTLKWMLHSNS